MPRRKNLDKLIGIFSKTHMKEGVGQLIDQGYNVCAASSAEGLAFQT